MSHLVAAIDGGTSNTRVRIWRTAPETEPTLLGQASAPVGAKVVAASGSPEPWKQAIRETLLKALEAAGAREEELAYAVASGALTSDIGVQFLPHVEGPATPEKLAAHARVVTDPAVTTRPLVFCTGFRNPVGAVSAADAPAVGFMRGEEYETLGILQQMGVAGEAVLVLPGSHTKFVHVGPGPELLSCVSTLTGELVEAIARHTTLSRSLTFPPYQELDVESALAGATLADRMGLPQVCFSIRALDLFGDLSPGQRGSVLMGALAAEDARALRALMAGPVGRGCPILVGGSRAMRPAYAAVLRQDPALAPLVVDVPDMVCDLAPNLGALAVAALAMAGR